MLYQGLGSFAVWILYGIFQARRSALIRASVGQFARLQRSLYGAGLMLGGVLALFGGFLAIQAIGGFGKAAMTPLGWLLATLSGLLFVHCQTIGMAMLVSLAMESVTTPATLPSTNSEPLREP